MAMAENSGLAADVAAFRRFNRIYTRLIGTLDEGLLHTRYSLAEARVIYELATRDNPTAKEIADTLGMDPGYLSRILTRFENSALLKRKLSKEDSRCAYLVLTAKGRSEFAVLNALSEEQARAMLTGLAPVERAAAIRSMRTIQRIFTPDCSASGRSADPPFVLRPHRTGDMGWVIHREGAVYAEEYGWDGTFEAFVARIAADFVLNFDPNRERCWIAEIDGYPVGHVFLVRHPEQPDTAKLRLLLVESSARGKGLGHALVAECVRFARTCGYRKISLWTQSILTAAHHIYQRAGFRLIKEEPHRSFGQDLVGQTWELELDSSEA